MRAEASNQAPRSHQLRKMEAASVAEAWTVNKVGKLHVHSEQTTESLVPGRADDPENRLAEEAVYPAVLQGHLFEEIVETRRDRTMAHRGVVRAQCVSHPQV